MNLRIRLRQMMGGAEPFSAAAFLLFVLHVLCLSVLSYVHTFWRDESNVWLMARDSASFAGMLYPVHYDGHPPLWDAMVFAVTRVTSDPAGLKLLTLLLSVCLSAAILLGNRLPLWKRAGIAFSYLFLFEYGTIERNYLPGILSLVLAVEWLLSDSPRLRFHAVWLLCLGALASSPTLLLALVTCVLWIYRDRRRSGDRAVWKRPDVSAATAAGVLAMAVCLATAYVVIRPPADSNLFVANVMLQKSVSARVLRFGAHFAQGIFAVPALRMRFWDTTEWSMDPFWRVSNVFGWVLFACACAYFRTAVARWYFLSGSVLVLALLVASGRAFERHVGFFFVAFVLALLLDEDAAGAGVPSALSPVLLRDAALACVLIAQVYGGIFAAWVTVQRPFSVARQVADFLRARKLEDAPMIIDPSEAGTSVLAYLHRRTAYSVEFGRPVSYIVWNRQEMQQRIPTPEEMSLASEGMGRTVLITEEPLPESDAQRLGVHLLASFDRSVCAYDRFFVYQ